MRIKVCGNLGHHTHGNMRKKCEYAFRELGHEIVEDNPDMTLTWGSMVHWNEIKDLSGKKLMLCHGVDWWRGFESPGNEKIKSVWENCDGLAYANTFAKHMAEKAFGVRDSRIIVSRARVDLPGEFPVIKDTIHIATCAIFRAWKRLHEMERLVKVLNDKGIKVELHVIGKDGEPPQNVHYYGLKTHEEIKNIYRKCHLYLHLAFNDYSPATVAEAMGFGLPVIITNSGGSKDLVQDAGIILETDPFVDYPFNIHSEGILPKVDDKIFEEGFFRLVNNLSAYQQKNKDWVLSWANVIEEGKEFIDLYNLC